MLPCPVPQVRSLEGGAPLEPVRGPAHPLGGDLWQLVVRAPPSVAHLVLESLATGQRLRIPFQTETGAFCPLPAPSCSSPGHSTGLTQRKPTVF